MKRIFKWLLALGLVAAAGYVVLMVPSIVTEGRWFQYTPPVRSFFRAAMEQDTGALRAQSVDPVLVDQILTLQRRRPRLLASATRSLRPKNGMRTGDTILVSFGFDHSECSPQGPADAFDFGFVRDEGDLKILWMRLRLCQ
jgi:hypothetical protein